MDCQTFQEKWLALKTGELVAEEAQAHEPIAVIVPGVHGLQPSQMGYGILWMP